MLQGDAGYSRKGGGAGEASFYYSVPRWRASGGLTVGQSHYRVEGLAWFDREWSTASLSADTRGWDWFALHLDDGSDLMLYQLRDHAGSATRWSAGTFVDREGVSSRIAAGQFGLEVTASWVSPAGHRYPAAWKLSITGGPAAGLELVVRPAMADQLWSGMVEYWEGAVTVSGRGRHGPVGGRGYVELVGYGAATGR